MQTVVTFELNSSVPANLDVQAVTEQWFTAFAKGLQAGDVDNVLSLLTDDVFWRDTLALTWDFRTFQSTPAVKQFLADRLSVSAVSSFKLRKDLVELEKPYPDIAWIQAFFDFETAVGVASGVFRLVPVADGTWKAHTVYTNLEDLKGHPEQVGARDYNPNHGKWVAKREREIEFLDEEPEVVIVGAGQSGLEIAARLKMLGLNALVAEKNERVGDNWRKRYAALCLHDPVWFEHMPYIPFPATWPVYIPAVKLGDWFESYAHSLELNVWTSATVTSVTPGSTKRWRAVVKRQDGRERVFEADHVIFALGLGGSVPNMPKFPGMDEFKGQILHSSKHRRATDHTGKKVVVVGSCTSAHDICADYAEYGVDVTMYQRSPTYIMSVKEGVPRLMAPLYWEGGPPTDIADRINASFPNHLMKLMHQRTTRDTAEADKNLLDGLRARGFKLTLGDEDSGFLQLVWRKSGGYYLDVGASQMIIDGKIKLKSDSLLTRFTPSGLEFEDGSKLDADVVLFATGFGDPCDAYRELLPEEIGSKLTRIWGLDEEGEIRGAWREVGFPGLWCMMGPFVSARYHSKHVALQIKAQEENLFGTRYR
ncbi:FAD/NAD(P)-binding domain-containing protein [Leucogyrophana mollusca]|uniref:FAD/NAD(P)-binding domain-containing protein n=1 Tax=Leucogyrophana mollusca TaxID=85980 RepID=A0ACB8B039_9AGAM|nr:FAD/NAD(P)-binding domain-containing protein [Leucogyrophana mollusca]